jgi:Kef-type K+ transport system membrane component KefB
MDILLAILAILVLAKVLGELVERVGYPALIGEIAAGVILGPSLLNLVAHDDVIEALSTIGVILLLFVIGSQMNLKLFVSSTARMAATAVTASLIPVCAGFLLGTLLHQPLILSFFLAIILSITSVGIVVPTLVSLNKINTEIGTTIIGVAVLDDLIALTMYGIFSSMAAGKGISTTDLLVSVVISLLFIIGMATVGRFVIRRVFALSARASSHEVSYAISLILAIAAALLSHAAGLNYVIGAFLAGLILGDLIRIDRQLFDSLTDSAFGFFVTLFFASVGLVLEITPQNLSPLIIPILLIAIGAKILGGFLGSIWFFKDAKSALLVGIGLCPKGDLPLAISKYALLAGLISNELYTTTVLTVIATIIITPALLKQGFRSPVEPAPQG